MGRLLHSGEPSSAIGRYQFIYGTLRALQKQKNLPGSTLFTPELQDNLAVTLMVARGYSKWYIGNLSDEGFAHGLSLEWASLPDPQNGGKSHYDGVGPNHAGLTLEYVYATLQRARSAQKAPAATTVAQTVQATPEPPKAPVEAPAVPTAPTPVAPTSEPPAGPDFWGWVKGVFGF